jgi:hypothetical protein
MEFGFKTLTQAVIIGSDLGLATARALFENIWVVGPLLGLCLLLYGLKLSDMLMLALMLFLMGGFLLFMMVS